MAAKTQQFTFKINMVVIESMMKIIRKVIELSRIYNFLFATQTKPYFDVAKLHEIVVKQNSEVVYYLV